MDSKELMETMSPEQIYEVVKRIRAKRAREWRKEHPYKNAEYCRRYRERKKTKEISCAEGRK